MDNLTLYDYLGFVVPGGLVVAAAAYGFDLAPIHAAPSTPGLALLTAAAFVVGHINAALGNFLQPAAWVHRPGSRLPSSAGLFGRRGLYSATQQAGIEQHFANRFPQADDFQQRFNLGYTELRQKELDKAAQIMNQQIGFYRNMAAGIVVALCVVIVAAILGHHTLRWWLWVPLGVTGEALFIFRFRRFWVRFGNEIVRGVQTLPNDASSSSDA